MSLQGSLFDFEDGGLPPGLVYQTGFLNEQEQAHWVAEIRGVSLEAMRYKAYVAKRRVVSYGGRHDFDDNRLEPTADLPPSFWPLRRKVADWAGLPEKDLAHVLLAEYSVGTPLGWHRDVPDFEDVIGVSLGSEAVMRLRPCSPPHQPKSAALRLTLAPGSVYRLSGVARWQWQHSLPPVLALRYSVTFRTRVTGRERGHRPL